jgi:hypothetical protein
MAAGTVTIRPSLPGQPVTGKIVYDGSPTATNVNLGFVPSMFKIINTSDNDVSLTWTADMADGAGITDAGAAVASGGITPVAQTDGTNHGVLVGTDASCMEASKTYSFIAWR